MRRVIRRIALDTGDVGQDTVLGPLYRHWSLKSEEFTKARSAVAQAKADLRAALAKNLVDHHGFTDETDWEFKEDRDAKAIVIEVVERTRKPRSQIETERPNLDGSDPLADLDEKPPLDLVQGEVKSDPVTVPSESGKGRQERKADGSFWRPYPFEDRQPGKYWYRMDRGVRILTKEPEGQ